MRPARGRCDRDDVRRGLPSTRMPRVSTAASSSAASGCSRHLARTMFEKMKYFEEHADWFRRLMLREPRGYPRACVNVLLPPTDDARRRRLRDHGAVGAVRGDVGHEPDGRGDRPPRDGPAADATEPTTTLRLEVPAGLIDVQRTVRGRARHARRVRERAVVRDRGRRPDRRARLRHGAGQRRLGRHGLRRRRRRRTSALELGPDQARGRAGGDRSPSAALPGEQIGFEHPSARELRRSRPPS